MNTQSYTCTDDVTSARTFASKVNEFCSFVDQVISWTLLHSAHIQNTVLLMQLTMGESATDDWRGGVGLTRWYRRDTLGDAINRNLRSIKEFSLQLRVWNILHSIWNFRKLFPYCTKTTSLSALKYWTDKHIVQILGEKLLGAPVWCYLWGPYVSKVLSQDKKNSPNFAKFLVNKKFFVNSSCVICIVSRTVRLDFSNYLAKCSYPPKIWRNLAKNF